MTNIQKQVLGFMIRHGGTVWLQTGSRKTRLIEFHENVPGPAIECSMNVFEGLHRNRWIEKEAMGLFYRVTDEARALLATPAPNAQGGKSK